MEICVHFHRRTVPTSSLIRGKWIEIIRNADISPKCPGLPSFEGSGLKYSSPEVADPLLYRLPSFEGSGLKYPKIGQTFLPQLSSLIRGKWIEISLGCLLWRRWSSSLIRGKWIEILLAFPSPNSRLCLPSFEGSGLKFSCLQFHKVHHHRLPSFEGSGLKYWDLRSGKYLWRSSLIRGKWIEMLLPRRDKSRFPVFPHSREVD